MATLGQSVHNVGVPPQSHLGGPVGVPRSDDSCPTLTRQPLPFSPTRTPLQPTCLQPKSTDHFLLRFIYQQMTPISRRVRPLGMPKLWPLGAVKLALLQFVFSSS